MVCRMTDRIGDSRLIAFLAALDRGPAPSVDVLPDLTAVRQVPRDPDLQQLFARHATESGMSVRPCRRSEIPEALLVECRAASVADAILAADETTPLAP